MMHQHERYQAAKRVTLLGALMNTLLGITKIIGGFMFHSHALIADGLHSFADLVTDGMVVFASKYGSQHADASHPYGHQRIETAATFFLSMLLIVTGVAIAWHSLRELLNDNAVKPDQWSLIVALLSIAINEALFHYTRAIGQRIKSDLILANAWHHRSDAASSFVVFVGLLGSIAGYAYLDALAAIIVGGLIIHMGGTYGWNSIKELVDTAVSSEQLSLIQHVIRGVDGVKKIHQLRSRTMGRDIFIDVHIQVDPYLSVSEGHYIAQHVHLNLINQVPDVRDVTVHVDPEDDEITPPSQHLPNRTTLEKTLLIPWRNDFTSIQSWLIHYLNGTLTIDLFCTTILDHNDAFRVRTKKDLANHDIIIHVRCFLITSLGTAP